MVPTQQARSTKAPDKLIWQCRSAEELLCDHFTSKHLNGFDLRAITKSIEGLQSIIRALS